MKHLLKSLSPSHLFKSKSKSKSVSKSLPSSFSSATTTSYSSESSSSHGGATLSHSSDDVTFRFDYVQAFKILDRDGDGKITPSELESILKKLIINHKVTESDVADMIGDIDRDGDGCISLDELRTVKSVFDPNVNGEDELREVFDVFDADHDGKITAEELHAVFSALGDGDRCTLDECRRMIDGVDVNGDGFVCFQDFTRMMDLHR